MRVYKLHRSPLNWNPDHKKQREGYIRLELQLEGKRAPLNLQHTHCAEQHKLAKELNKHQVERTTNTPEETKLLGWDLGGSRAFKHPRSLQGVLEMHAGARARSGFAVLTRAALVVAPT
jgi:hypothetical protein